MRRRGSKNLPVIVVAVLATAVAVSMGALLWVSTGFASARTTSTPSPRSTASPAFTLPPTAAPTAAPSPTPKPTPSPTAAPTATPEPTPVPVELGETEDAGQEYIDKMVFLGDSTTYWLAGYDVLPFTQVWTDSIGTMSLFNWEIDPINYYDPASPTTPVSLFIPDCAARRQPEYLVITLGLNGIAFLDEQEFRDYYLDMLDAIMAASPDTKIICQSIFPVIDSRVPKGISNEKINTANKWIYAMAEEKGLRYLNAHDVLMDENGQLRLDYTDDTAMGIHMNTTGLNAMLMNIRTHAWQ